MKHLIPLAAVCALGRLCTFAQDAGTHVAVHAGETPIEQLLTDEQKSSVTHLAVTGKLLDADYSFIRTSLLKQLQELNLREAVIDTLPSSALEYCDRPDRNKVDMKVVLPRRLSHLSKRSFYTKHKVLTFEVTGHFPSLSYETFYYDEYGWETSLYNNDGQRVHDLFVPSEDNTSCIMIPHSGLYSAGADTLYFASGGFDHFADGTKAIAGHAFEGNFMECNVFEIPASVDSIGDMAFANMHYPVPTRSFTSWSDIFFYNYAPIPQRLGRDVFYRFDSDDVALVVPDESRDLYRHAEGWSSFRNIFGLSGNIEGIDNPSSRTVNARCSFDGNILSVSSDKTIEELNVYDTPGELIASYIKIHTSECSIPLHIPYGISVIILKVSFVGGFCETIKVAL